jgi:hypothetical protein
VVIVVTVVAVVTVVNVGGAAARRVSLLSAPSRQLLCRGEPSRSSARQHTRFAGCVRLFRLFRLAEPPRCTAR